jgi:NADP-dependent alcohol dehydrogenase
MEQYLTYPVGAHLQDRQAEAILLTLIDQSTNVQKNPKDYETRAAIMWSATQALNGLIGCGVPEDWATHGIGHELTALHGVDHAQSLAIVLPGVMEHERERKREKLLQYGERVWDIRDGDERSRIDEAIARTDEFFRETGCRTRLSDYGIPESTCRVVAERLEKRGVDSLGEHSAITPSDVEEILKLRL